MPFYNNIGTNYFLVGLFPVTNRTPHTIISDDLPVWGMVGEYFEEEGTPRPPPKVFIYTHKKFAISWNDDRVTYRASCVYSDLVDHLPNRLSRST